MELNARSWLDRVETSANPGDDPSRHNHELCIRLGCTRRETVFDPRLFVWEEIEGPANSIPNNSQNIVQQTQVRAQSPSRPRKRNRVA